VSVRIPTKWPEKKESPWHTWDQLPWHRRDWRHKWRKHTQGGHEQMEDRWRWGPLQESQVSTIVAPLRTLPWGRKDRAQKGTQSLLQTDPAGKDSHKYYIICENKLSP
jgi:hypothetical protein